MAFGKELRIPVQISVDHIEGETVVFQPLIAPKFFGKIDGPLKKKISECESVVEKVADLKDGGELDNLVLHCGDRTIVVRGVQF